MSNLYVFLDEAGNFDFSPSGTKFFCLSSVTCVRPFVWDSLLHEVKCDLLESDLNIYRFHASEDKQKVRDKVFEVICNHISNLRIDSVIVEKNKTQEHLRKIEKFFPKMMGYLVKHIWSQVKDSGFEKIVFITDSIPVKKRRDIVEKTIKQTLAEVLPGGVRHSIYHHPSQSCFSLQIADYCNWAIFKKWEREDRRSYELIKKGIKSEFDIFRRGSKLY
ncbi:MAG TPA: DUF3800 domain-containing protein [Nitrospirales bacterium]|nr:hypothetical protein [Nitrospiraceae bacterium]HNP27908.1 DUF3800 domain-containing protein [Nitrospirales bacterium]